MRLSTRLILLILGCMLPILGAQIYTQVNLHAERQSRISRLTLRRAELANRELSSIVDGVTQLAVALGQFPSVANLSPACNERLSAVQHDLPAYRFLAVAGASGRLSCASNEMLTQPTHDKPEWLADLPNSAGSTVGHLATATGIDGPFLPIAVRMPPPTNAPGSERYLVAALDLRWLAHQLEVGKLDRSPLLEKSTFILADREGMVLMRNPDGEQWVGRALPDHLKALATKSAPGVTIMTGPDGETRLVAYVPAKAPPVGRVVIETLSLSDLTDDLERASGWDLLVISGAAVIALILAWLAGQRFIYQPTEALMHAARRWRDGDLTARATPSETGSEFAALAQSFNAMAAGLQTRDLERRLQAQFLESQVAERTRELSETNNRLQVEIAEREKTEAALHQAQKLQAVGQLAGGIAHDFNNMLATVLGNLELMERRVAQSTEGWTRGDAERLARLIERATGAVQRGAQLTSHLLAFSRRQRLSARPTDLNKLVTELITLATSTLGRRVRVIPDLVADLWPAQVDPSQVEAAILNLCLNARDAMKDGGQLTIKTANEMLAQRQHDDDPPPGPYVRVSIADTGVGMSSEVMQRAFDPFFTTKQNGSGLGLSQVYGIARQLGGTVRIASTLGQGTEVSLLLPRAASPAQAEIPAAEVETEAAKVRQPAELVLVVDDDHAVRQVTVEMLRDLGNEVLQAQGGAEALVLLEGLSDQPRLILLDYAMPGMNGLQLARRLRERGLCMPIALVTGYAELNEVDAHASPLDGLLRKPFTIRELQALLERLRANRAEIAGRAGVRSAVREAASSSPG
jgi:signal transduction histidine kinase/FixJ family two-component response regulator